MLKIVRRLSGSLAGLVSELEHISGLLFSVLQRLETFGPLEDRLAELERTRNQWEAKVEAELIRSDSRFKQARAAEERTRTMAANAEALSSSDEGEDSFRDEYLEFLRRNGEGVEPGAVQAMPAPLAVDPKTRAIQAKFARLG